MPRRPKTLPPLLEHGIAAQAGLALAQLAGVDEVGRGCLFGPVWAAAVVLPPQAFEGLRSLGVTDSKALSAKRRAALLPVIESQLLAFGYGQASAQEIDAKGIRVATELAMLRALQRLQQPPAHLLVDGSLPLRPWPGSQECVVAGDRHCLTIACASILAKQGRDALLQRLEQRWPGYGLAKHKGYGTREHRDALLRLGPTPMHRLSFLSAELRQPAGGASAENPAPAGAPPGL
ncbi:MAG: ribonuclease HII [Synechococcus sp.]|nr:ribonuclease HII [Synechococcus sp.]